MARANAAPNVSPIGNLDLTPEELINHENFSEFTIGAYLGPERNENEITHANIRAEIFFQHFNFLPIRNDAFFCNRMINNQGVNQRCGLPMGILVDRNKKLGFRLVYRGGLGNLSHQLYRPSPLTDTLLSDQHIHLRQLFKILINFLLKRPVKDLYNYGIASQTATQWYVKLREAMTTVAWHSFNKIGGYGDVIEIDETLIFKRKNNVGRILRDVWIFGGISRTSNECFVVRVPRRDRPTLESKILDSINPGSIICSDGWRAYNQIERIPRENNIPKFYRQHGVVHYNVNFTFPPMNLPPLWMNDLNIECIDTKFIGPLLPPGPNTLYPFRIHTQKIERIWKELKKFVKTDRSEAGIDHYLGEYMYRQNILRTINGLGNKFLRFLQDIRTVYPGLDGTTRIRSNKPNFTFTNLPARVITCECNNCTRN